MTDEPRYRLDDLRRFATALGAGAGVAPGRAAALAAQLLWYDAAGAPGFGLETLCSWLDRMASGAVDPRAEAAVVEETLGTAVLDGRNGLPPLTLARAGELAIEKARDAGTGLVRVTNIGPTGPAAAVAADMSVGPVLAFLLGPGPALSLAVPTDEGLPAVYDSALAAGGEAGSRGKRAGRSAKPSPLEAWEPWASVVVPEGDWLVSATGVKSIEPLAGFQARVGSRMKGLEESAGRLLPASWEARRRAAREHGVGVTEAVRARLNHWAERLGVPLLTPATDASASAPPPAGAL